ncbi:MAG: hydantoinase/oxoprolinase family protein [Reyranellaceae bacterium]
MAIATADIGGTFTDLVMLGDDGTLIVDKRLSTRDDYGRAVTQGICHLLEKSGGDRRRLGEIRHGTTVATNAILERQGARTALLTTAGFRDVLEIGRLRTPKLYDINWSKPVPLVERRFRFELDERMAATGQPLKPVDRAEVVALGRRMSEAGIESVAVCFLNAYVNDGHELEVERILQQEFPRLDVAISSRVLREMREFERTSTTVADAYVKPVMRAYLQALRAGLEREGLSCPVFVMQSNGGVLDLAQTVRRPVYAIESGPAAGIIGARQLGLAAGIANAITFDMGGTTAKASMIEAGRIDYSPEFEIGGEVSRNSRLIKGSGYLIRTPAIDVAEVGAGGGSIAWLDPAGGLKVGPISAGSSPGPACYMLGGTRPTVTDANLVLGLLNPNGLAGGAVPVSIAAARTAIERDIAVPLQITCEEAAQGIHDIANANMARAIRAVSTERGRDVRLFKLLAFGGNGGIHAGSLARMFGMSGIVVPPNPGVFSAVGLLYAEKEQHLVYSLPGSRILLQEGLLAEHLPRIRAQMRQGDVAMSEQAVEEWFADLRYLGQGHDLRIAIGADDAADEIRRKFAAEHRQQYGHDFGDMPIEVINLRVIMRETREAAARPAMAGRRPPAAPGSAPAPGSETRRCFFGGNFAFRAARILKNRAELGAGAVSGPVVIEEYDTTIVVPPDFEARLDELGNVHLTPTSGAP